MNETRPAHSLPPILQGNDPVRRVLRAMLETDKPIPVLTEAQFTAEVERNYAWNFWFNLLDGASFGWGVSLASSTTVMPLFISKLTTNPLAVGVFGAFAQGGWFVPQLFTANVVEQLPRKKPIVVNLGFFLERLPVWLMALAALLALRVPTIALFLFVGAFAWHVVGAGVVATAWQAMIARFFPVTRRGRFFGLTNLLGAGIGILASMLGAYLLDHLSYPGNFAWVFLLSAFFINLSWVFLALTREPLEPTAPSYVSGRDFWRGLLPLLREDHNFRRFLVSRLLLTAGGMGGMFLAIAASQRWQLDDGVAALYTGASLVGQTLGHLIVGFIADRVGHKRVIVTGALVNALSYALAWQAAAPEWYYAVFALQGLASSMIIVSGMLAVMELSPAGRLPTYTGLVNTVNGLAGIITPLIGAALAKMGYPWLFALSFVLCLLATGLMQVWVRDPRTLQPAA